MPTSIVSTFLLLQVSGLSLNMMTLMGLSVSVGVLVANSIVVIENIFRFRKMGESIKQASYHGTSEVMVAVLASTLTNLVVFLPIANMSSMVGMWLRELALAAVFATIFSLIMSFTLTPMLASLVLGKEHKPGRLSSALDAFEEKQTRFYSKLLGKILRNKFNSFIVVASSFLALILVIIFFGTKIGFEFLPTFDDGKIKISVEMPEGYNLQATGALLSEIENRLKRHKEVTHMITNLGRMSQLDIGTNMALMDVQLVDANERDISLQDMISVFVKELADIPNARIKVDLGSSAGGPGSPVQFFLMGQDLDKLDQYKDVIVKRVKDIPGLINFDQSSRAGKPEITVIPKREKLVEAGLSITDLALTLRSSVEGIQSSKYRELGNEYDITVTMDDNSVDSPEKISGISIASPVGPFRLEQLADIKFTKGYTKILHRDKYIAIMFTGAPASGVPLGNITGEIDRRLSNLNLPPGYYIRWGGNVKMMNDMIQDMIFAFFLAVFLTYMLLAALLESFWQPVPIMMTVVLCMIGVILAIYISNIAFNVVSMMAIVMLIGIVVNNAILMLDYSNQLRREKGMMPKDALLEACPTKLKPQIMSTVAIILGMLPMALGIGAAGKEMRIPLAIVSIGGLLVSTFLTLFVIPAFYYLTSKTKAIDVSKREKVG